MFLFLQLSCSIFEFFPILGFESIQKQICFYNLVAVHLGFSILGFETC